MNVSQRKYEQFMEWAVAGAKVFSTCSRRQYMAIVLSADGRVIGTGYNGGPSGFVHCVDGGCPRSGTDVAAGSLYDNCIAIHAEANALLHSDRAARLGGTLIINGPPCYGCAKLIAGSGVAKVVYMTDPAYAEWGKVRMLLQKSKIIMVEIDSARIAGASVGRESCGNVGCGVSQEVGVALQSYKPAIVADNDYSWPIMGLAAAFARYDSDLSTEQSERDQ